eukprot:CAMPEP_0117420910 /NCGR_PEP_ID=MMETSP0758-20121206/2143_1 /TAXON_ID=63605 /ORGANISM="Percolomonas cosmopolitus, Strain AE-1 (ATCC 50343)" /LENGTH=339 /DNA_ID=CAMNT_0005202789 /DNA_START=1380 /DNA_END=2399 /DNA_ORIENTATION=+
MIKSAEFIQVLPTVVNKIHVSFSYVEKTYENLMVREISHERMHQYIESLGHLIPQLYKEYEGKQSNPFTQEVQRVLKLIVYSICKILPKCLQAHGELLIQCLGELLVIPWISRDVELMNTVLEELTYILLKEYEPDIIYFKKRVKSTNRNVVGSDDNDNVEEDVEFKLAMAVHSWAITFFQHYPKEASYVASVEQRNDALTHRMNQFFLGWIDVYSTNLKAPVRFDTDVIERIAAVKSFTLLVCYVLQESSSEEAQQLILETVETLLHTYALLNQTNFKTDKMQSYLHNFLKRKAIHTLYKEAMSSKSSHSKLRKSILQLVDEQEGIKPTLIKTILSKF